MSRKIKFRGLTKANNVMVFGDLIHCPNGSHRIIGYEQKGEIPLDVDYNDFNELIQSSTIGEFTGLHDKNGVEIYEGDILAFEQEKNFKKVFIHHFEIKWNNDRAAWTQFSPLELIVVVGNIYQNPELLTSKTTQS
jgi:uncharacterized phage protein (TIGR01671 family)